MSKDLIRFFLSEGRVIWCQLVVMYDGQTDGHQSVDQDRPPFLQLLTLGTVPKFCTYFTERCVQPFETLKPRSRVRLLPFVSVYVHQ